ncbi:MAG: GNAT family N-acetyltransferase [Hamadaea sp.]|nr:GNAT family N-acetyltransferase [Hamadaea sp.]
MTQIRPLTAADVDAVVAVHMSGWRTAYKGIIADEILNGLDPAAWTARYHRELELRAAGEAPWQTLVCLDEAGEPQGHVNFGPWRADPDGIDPDIGEILSIYVAEHVYGRGHAAALLEAALEALPQREVRLWVLEENHRARRFYEKHGLRPDGTRELWTPRGATVSYPEIRYSVLR